MSAPVKKHHRYFALWALPDVERALPDVLYPEEREWAETGVVPSGLNLREAVSVAQALADLEAATAHRAWNEGYDYAEERFSEEPWKPGPPVPPNHSANPYPAPEPKP